MREKKPLRLKPLTIHPLEWWEAMEAFMKIPYRKAKKIKEKTKKKVY